MPVRRSKPSAPTVVAARLDETCYSVFFFFPRPPTLRLTGNINIQQYSPTAFLRGVSLHLAVRKRLSRLPRRRNTVPEVNRPVRLLYGRAGRVLSGRQRNLPVRELGLILSVGCRVIRWLDASDARPRAIVLSIERTYIDSSVAMPLCMLLLTRSKRINVRWLRFRMKSLLQDRRATYPNAMSLSPEKSLDGFSFVCACSFHFLRNSLCPLDRPPSTSWLSLSSSAQVPC